jgi:subtilase family protein/fibronectin type III domain protein/PA domain-containing protein/peptidase inhibitor I9
MSSATPARCRRSAIALACALSALLTLGLSPVASADPPDPTEASVPDPTEASVPADGPEVAIPTGASTESDYIVTLADAPIAAYDGDVAGYDATQPADGEDVDVDSADAKRYRSYLRKRQDTVAARIGSTPDERYEVGLNAFTAEITGEQAATLARTDGVVSVHRNTLRRVPDDKKSVDFLGLSGSDGVWSRLGGPDDAGRGVVVGVLDTGIWPESASFAGEPLRASSRQKGRGGARYVPTRSGETVTMVKSDGGTFTGRCQSGEDFTVDDCNSKIVGARYFGDTWLARVPPAQRDDVVSPRDGEGHGSHTASIAAGNHGVRAVVDDRDFGRISGVAPAAKIAAYKVVWQAKDAAQTGAYDSDVLAAIDAAISDGVDVINFSITSADDPTAPVQLAFLSAASAGIFVATSAGNSGPGASTVQSTSPWVTTVGAHTIAPYYGTVTLGNGQAYAGISTSVDEQVGPAPLVNGAAVVAAGQTAANAAACTPGSLDPAKAAGAIVVCARGVVDRIVKSAEVERAGGIGMVLANLTPNTLDADLHDVPTVHVDPPASTEITAYAATAGATATLTEGNETSTELAYPQIATFSSRGPSVGTGGDTLKPDLVAPGVSILGAVAPPRNEGRDFGFLSGTSESAPQVSGLAALWFGAGVRPKWSPMTIKSALMTTAADLVDGTGRRATDPFAQGAGRVVPDRMFEPGLVYPAGQRDWLGYLEGLGMDTGTQTKAIDPSDYNAPSIAIGRLVGQQTVTRRVTAVAAGRYRVSAKVPGVDIDVSPSVLDFQHAGQTKTFRVTFTPTTAEVDRPATGTLTWKGRRGAVRVPLAVTPRALEAPAQVAGRGSSGQVRFRVTSGSTGTFTAVASGLATGGVRTGSLTIDQSFAYRVRPAPGTKAARFTVRSSEAKANLDLYVYQYDANAVARLVGQSTGPSSTESFVVAKPSSSASTSGSPVPGDYALQVVNAGNAPGTTATPFTAQTGLVVPTGGEGSFTVTPAQTEATAGRPFVLTAGWTELPEGVPYVGWIEYPGGRGTVVTVN